VIAALVDLDVLLKRLGARGAMAASRSVSGPESTGMLLINTIRPTFAIMAPFHLQ